MSVKDLNSILSKSTEDNHLMQKENENLKLEISKLQSEITKLIISKENDTNKILVLENIKRVNEELVASKSKDKPLESLIEELKIKENNLKNEFDKTKNELNQKIIQQEKINNEKEIEIQEKNQLLINLKEDYEGLKEKEQLLNEEFNKLTLDKEDLLKLNQNLKILVDSMSEKVKLHVY